MSRHTPFLLTCQLSRFLPIEVPPCHLRSSRLPAPGPAPVPCTKISTSGRGFRDKYSQTRWCLGPERGTALVSDAKYRSRQLPPGRAALTFRNPLTRGGPLPLAGFILT
jgi:hypothetical protein